MTKVLSLESPAISTYPFGGLGQDSVRRLILDGYCKVPTGSASPVPPSAWSAGMEQFLPASFANEIGMLLCRRSVNLARINGERNMAHYLHGAFAARPRIVVELGMGTEKEAPVFSFELDSRVIGLDGKVVFPSALLADLAERMKLSLRINGQPLPANSGPFHEGSLVLNEGETLYFDCRRSFFIPPAQDSADLFFASCDLMQIPVFPDLYGAV